MFAARRAPSIVAASAAEMPVNAGVYFYRLSFEGKTRTNRMAVVR